MADNLQMMLKSVQQELKSIKEAQTRYEKEHTQKPSDLFYYRSSPSFLKLFFFSRF